MDCRECESHFSALLEGEPEAGAAQRHLQECAACARAFVAFRQAVAAVRGLSPPTPPTDLRRRIRQAIEAEAVRQRTIGAWWQPLTAGLSLAACLALFLWATALQPTRPLGNYEGLMVGPGAGGATAASVIEGTVAKPERQAQAERPVFKEKSASVRRGAGRRSEFGRQWKRERQARGGVPASFGQWAQNLKPTVSPVVQLRQTAEAANVEKPAGTFAAPEEAEEKAPQGLLRRQAGPVTIAFRPPPDRPVGQPIVGLLTVTGEAEAMITLRVASGPGLRVMHAPKGVLYAGPLRRGETLKIPVRVLAWRPGGHWLEIRMESDVPGVTADLPIELMGFTGEIGKNGQEEVHLKCEEKPVQQAIREMAAEAGARVVIAEELEPRRVSLDFSAGVPFAAALRILADECGYRVEEREDVFYIWP